MEKVERRKVFELNGTNIKYILLLNLSMIFLIANRIYLGKIFDTIVTYANQPKKLVLSFGLLLILTVICIVTSIFFSHYLPLRREIVLEIESEVDVMNKTLDMPLFSFSKQRHGYFYNLLMKSSGTFGCIYGHINIELIASIISLVILLAVMFWIHPLYALLMLGYVPIAALATVKPAAIVAEIQKDIILKQDKMLGCLKGNLERKRSITVTKNETYFKQKFQDVMEQWKVYILRFRLYTIIVDNLPTGVASLFQLALLACATWFYLKGSTTLGRLISIYQLGGLVQTPLTRIFEIITHYRANVPHLERLAQFDQLAAETNPNDRNYRQQNSLAVIEPGVFSTTGEEGKELFTVEQPIVLPKKGLTVVKGANGSGKSMLINLLTNYGQFSDYKGALSFDQTLNRPAYLTYPLLLTSGSFEDNLFGKGYDPAVAELLDLTFKDKTIDDEKVNLSFGEGQKLNLLRVLSEPSSVVVLDEPFSNLDTNTIARLSQYLIDLKGQKAVVAITHSPELDKAADRILRIIDGKLKVEK